MFFSSFETISRVERGQRRQKRHEIEDKVVEGIRF